MGPSAAAEPAAAAPPPAYLIDTPAPLRQFRTAQNNEDDVTQNDLPPVGGFVLMCAGQLMLLSGAVQHVAGAYALRQRLRLTPVGCAAVLAHALLPMAHTTSRGTIN